MSKEKIQCGERSTTCMCLCGGVGENVFYRKKGGMGKGYICNTGLIFTCMSNMKIATLETLKIISEGDFALHDINMLGMFSLKERVRELAGRWSIGISSYRSKCNHFSSEETFPKLIHKFKASS